MESTVGREDAGNGGFVGTMKFAKARRRFEKCRRFETRAMTSTGWIDPTKLMPEDTKKLRTTRFHRHARRDGTMEVTHTNLAARRTKPTFELIEDETLYVEKKRGLPRIVQEDLEATFDRLLRDFMQRSHSAVPNNASRRADQASRTVSSRT
jgi:hypothetical protein